MDQRDGDFSSLLKSANLIVGALIVILGVGLFDLQILKFERFKALAENNYIVAAPVRAPRGDIIDREGNLIATSRQAFSICGIPCSLLRHSDEMLLLAEIIGTDIEFVKSKLQPQAYSYRPTPIARDVDFSLVSKIEEMFSKLPDVLVISEPVRYYPFGAYYSHVIGYVGEATKEDLSRPGWGYKQGDLVGKIGLEYSYEGHLRGRDGVRYIKFTPKGGSGPVDFEDRMGKMPRRGSTLVITLDRRLQTLATDCLMGQRGAVVAIDPRDGSVLALVSSPNFDPNLVSVSVVEEYWKQLITASDKPLLNRAINASYPPGSTFKIVTASIALEEGKITRHTHFQPCYGSYRFGKRTFKCWKPEGHGSMDLPGAMMVSCDVYFYQVGERLTPTLFDSYGQKWRIAEKTGIDLYGEIKGFVPSPDYYDRVYGKGKWATGLMLNLAIGQGEILTTPIELACFVCGIANRGWYFTPHCVDSIIDASGIKKVMGERIYLPMRPTTIENLRESMRLVVEGPAGTGRLARVEGIESAGKTGTAQNPHGEDHAWYVGFAPYDDPEIVICVFVENGGSGGAVAAPIAKRLIEKYLGLGMDQEVALE
ncbi:MAG: penicillin-binding protein 2 [bacterium]